VKLRQATTTILFSAATLLTPAALSAQFTTFVAPPRKETAPVAKTVAATKAKVDSVNRMTLTNMKAWVDSAAGTSTQVAATNDTTMAAANVAANAVTPAPTVPNADRRTTTFSSGAIAPNTATSLPTYLLGGLILLTAGLVLLRRHRLN
jgi:LPXTG-motif cell wall-anchored protein